MEHGGGGKASRELIEHEILRRFESRPLLDLADGATLEVSSNQIVMSTDSYVVHPLSFPGGDIGKLSVYGTINDLAVSGGRPRWLSLAFILEEGLSISLLEQVLDNIQAAVKECRVEIVTGDTKVVPRGRCDGMYINTTGIGEKIEGFSLSSQNIRPKDRIVVSGSLGDHGMAVMAARENLAIQAGPISDTASVHRLVESLAEFGPAIRFMRDPTRGGLAATVHECIGKGPRGARINEVDLPFSPQARVVAEMLGIDLLHVASEGKMILVCDAAAADAVTKRLRSLPEGKEAAIIGEITDQPGRLTLVTSTGHQRLVAFPQGDLLPRIC